MEETNPRQQAVAEPLPVARPGWPAERVIKPAKRRVRLRDIPGHTPVIRVLAARDLKVRYKQSILGPLWLIFQPLALLAGFFVAFQGITDAGTTGAPYVLFALVGLSVWSIFQSAVTIGTASVLTNASFVRHTPCPRTAFPIAAVVSSLPAFAVTATAAFIATAVTGHLSPRVVLVPLALVWLVVLILGAVAISSSLAVRYRDINSALPFFLQVGLFLAPVGYSLETLSSTVRSIVEVNPLTGVLEATRWMMLSGYDVSLEPIVFSLGATMLLAVGGWRLFSRLETTMADEI